MLANKRKQMIKELTEYITKGLTEGSGPCNKTRAVVKENLELFDNEDLELEYVTHFGVDSPDDK